MGRGNRQGADRKTGRLIVMTRMNVTKHAGAKAPADVRSICMTAGFEAVDLPVVPDQRFNTTNLVRFMAGGGKLLLEALRLRADDIVLVQHPVVGRLENEAVPIVCRNARRICLVHDVDFIRKPTNRNYDDIKFLRGFEVVIVHNAAMLEKLKPLLPGSKLVSLEIFDYIAASQNVPLYSDAPNCLYVIGNLHPMKANYLYGLPPLDVAVEAYGPNFDQAAARPDVHWNGVLDMNDPKLSPIKGFGLVWDGISASELEGEWGEYLKINTPHKLSFYISLGIPVIIHRKAAMAPFVLQHRIGFLTDSIQDASAQVKTCTSDQWRSAIANVALLRSQLQVGYYTKSAVESALAAVSGVRTRATPSPELERRAM
jgi:hypothetical protein